MNNSFLSFGNYRSLATQSGDLGLSVVVRHKVGPNYQKIPFGHLPPVDRLDENYDGRKLSEKRLLKLRLLRLKNPVKFTAKKLAQLAHVEPAYIEQTVPAPPLNTAQLAMLKAKLEKKHISPEEKERRKQRLQVWLAKQKANIPKFIEMRKKWRQGAHEDMTKVDTEWARAIIKRTLRQDKRAARIKKERKVRPQQED